MKLRLFSKFLAISLSLASTRPCFADPDFDVLNSRRVESLIYGHIITHTDQLRLPLFEGHDEKVMSLTKDIAESYQTGTTDHALSNSVPHLIRTTGQPIGLEVLVEDWTANDFQRILDPQERLTVYVKNRRPQTPGFSIPLPADWKPETKEFHILHLISMAQNAPQTRNEKQAAQAFIGQLRSELLLSNQFSELYAAYIRLFGSGLHSTPGLIEPQSHDPKHQALIRSLLLQSYLLNTNPNANHAFAEFITNDELRVLGEIFYDADKNPQTAFENLMRAVESLEKESNLLNGDYRNPQQKVFIRQTLLQIESALPIEPNLTKKQIQARIAFVEKIENELDKIQGSPPFVKHKDSTRVIAIRTSQSSPCKGTILGRFLDFFKK